MAQAESRSDRTHEYQLKARLRRVVSNNVVDFEMLREIVSTGETSGLLLSDSLSSALLQTCRTGNVDAAEYLLDHGAAVDWVARIRNPPALICAVINKHPAMVQLLVTRGADINVRDSNGRTALMTAAWNDSYQILDYLIMRGADVNARDLRGRNVLHNLAADKRQDWGEYIVELLLKQSISISGEEARDELRRTPLHWACSTGHGRLVEMLLSKNADVDAVEARTKTSLSLAVTNNKVSIVETLLKNGADVNSKSDGGWTPLHQACETESAEIAKILLQAGAEVNAKLLNGSTPLHLAALKGCMDVVKCLLRHPNIKTRVKDAFGLTALHRAAQRNHTECLELLNEDVGSLSDDALGSTNGFTATVVEFGNFRNENRVYRRSVYEVLYGRDPINIRKPAFNVRPTDKATSFKWIHLPANNLAWVEKLMIKLFIEDGASGSHDLGTLQGSLNHQHRGYQAHSWFMRPTCQVILPRQKQDVQATVPPQAAPIIFVNEHQDNSPGLTPAGRSNTTYNKEKTEPKYRPDSFFLYMPYLHYESERGRRDMQEAILKSGRFSKAPNAQHPRSGTYDEMLIRGHLTPSRVSLHVRRTLDQYFYPNSSTVARDKDQVVGRYQAIQSNMDAYDFDPNIIMVDQLWLWVIDSNLIITAFPQRWGQPKDDAFSALDGILDSINSKTNDPVTSVYDLATVITTYCSSVLTDSVDVDVEDGGDNGEQYQFLRMFDASLGRATDRESALFRDLRSGFSNATDSLQEARRASQFLDDLESRETSKDSTAAEKLLRIDQEIDLLVEIKDIRDELNMISKVLDDNRQILPDLQAIIRDIYEYQPKRQVVFKKRFRDQLKRTENYMRDIGRMDKQAERVYTSIIDMLDLKQKHASNTNAFEAKFARQQAEGSAKQNQILMVFTIVTIIFLPLSFIAGFFTINIREFSSLSGNDDGRLPLAFVVKYIFGVGLAVSIPMIILALNLGNFLKLYNQIKARWGRSRQDIRGGDLRQSLDLIKIEEIIGSAGRNGDRGSLAGRKRRNRGISTP